MYLLDDILAAVDPPVANWLLERAICGPLLQNKTRIVCTHSNLCSQAADVLLRLSGGKLQHVSRQADQGNSQVALTEASYTSEVRAPTQLPQKSGEKKNINTHQTSATVRCEVTEGCRSQSKLQ